MIVSAGLGRNGAQKTPEATDGFLGDTESVYNFEAGKIYNLNADSIITNHSDICHPQSAHALLEAIESAPN